MSEQNFFLAGAVFLGASAILMVRLGRKRGGPAWAGAWLCLFVSRIVQMLKPELSAIAPLGPAFGATFATLLFAVALLFTGRVDRIPREIWLAALA